MNGIYDSTMGMLNAFAKLDAITNNLANSETTGYKKDSTVFKAYLEKNLLRYTENSPEGVVIGKVYSGTVLDKTLADFTQGQITETGNKTDFAISGNGFFKINKDGEFYYTRNGEFKISEQGYLVTNDGGYVLDTENNPIIAGNSFNVSGDGRVNNSDIIINTVDLESPYKIGSNYFKGNEVSAENNKVYQGSLEKSNVDSLNEMVKMINANRVFDILQKAVQSDDSMTQKLIETYKL
ncbi:MAG: flagellar hook-basal body protein [Thermotogae bacterium]|nr:flagellar hook-basal body protein [Thermotogota bacterium]MCP5465462.1 flagellar hook-basal body protein [Thermotogota bacterium]